MSFESMDTTKRVKRPKKEETEDTQVAKPVATAETILKRPHKIAVEKGPIVVVPPKTEEREFKDWLISDEEETEKQVGKLREEISEKPKKEPPMLERRVSEDTAQIRILEGLTAALKESRGTQDIDRDDLEKILDSKESLAIRIKTILNIAAADKIEDINTREKIFKIIYKALKEREGRDIRKAFEEIGELEGITSAEKKEKIAQKISQIKEKYGIEEIFEYLRLGEKEGGTIELE